MLVWQLQVTIPEQPFQIGNPFAGLAGAIDRTLVLVAVDIVLLFFLLIILIWLLRLFFRRRSLLPAAFKKVVLQVTLPRPTTVTPGQPTINLIRTQIGATESLLTTLGGLKRQRGFKTWLFGRHDHITFELAVSRRALGWYVGVPNYLADYVKQYITTQYPAAQITAIADYNIFSPSSSVLAASLKLTRQLIFPLNTYLNLNADPLQAAIYALGQIESEDGAAIQLVVRPAPAGWQRRGSKIAQLMESGKTLAEAFAETGSFNLARLGLWFTPKLKSHKPPALSPQQEESIQGIKRKVAKAGFESNIRLIVTAQTLTSAQHHLKNLADSFSQFNFYQAGNSLKVIRQNPHRLANDFLYRDYRSNQRVLLNAEELASLFHF